MTMGQLLINKKTRLYLLDEMSPTAHWGGYVVHTPA